MSSAAYPPPSREASASPPLRTPHSSDCSSNSDSLDTAVALPSPPAAGTLTHASNLSPPTPSATTVSGTPFPRGAPVAPATPAGGHDGGSSGTSGGGRGSSRHWQAAASGPASGALPSPAPTAAPSPHPPPRAPRSSRGQAAFNRMAASPLFGSSGSSLFHSRSPPAAPPTPAASAAAAAAAAGASTGSAAPASGINGGSNGMMPSHSPSSSATSPTSTSSNSMLSGGAPSPLSRVRASALPVSLAGAAPTSAAAAAGPGTPRFFASTAAATAAAGAAAAAAAAMAGEEDTDTDLGMNASLGMSMGMGAGVGAGVGAGGAMAAARAAELAGGEVTETDAETDAEPVEPSAAVADASAPAAARARDSSAAMVAPSVGSSLSSSSLAPPPADAAGSFTTRSYPSTTVTAAAAAAAAATAAAASPDTDDGFVTDGTDTERPAPTVSITEAPADSSSRLQRGFARVQALWAAALVRTRLRSRKATTTAAGSAAGAGAGSSGSDLVVMEPAPVAAFAAPEGADVGAAGAAGAEGAGGTGETGDEGTKSKRCGSCSRRVAVLVTLAVIVIIIAIVAIVLWQVALLTTINVADIQLSLDDTCAPGAIVVSVHAAISNPSYFGVGLSATTFHLYKNDGVGLRVVPDIVEVGEASVGGDKTPGSDANGNDKKKQPKKPPAEPMVTVKVPKVSLPKGRSVIDMKGIRIEISDEKDILSTLRFATRMLDVPQMPFKVKLPLKLDMGLLDLPVTVPLTGSLGADTKLPTLPGGGTFDSGVTTIDLGNGETQIIDKSLLRGFRPSELLDIVGEMIKSVKISLYGDDKRRDDAMLQVGFDAAGKSPNTNITVTIPSMYFEIQAVLPSSEPLDSAGDGDDTAIGGNGHVNGGTGTGSRRSFVAEQVYARRVAAEPLMPPSSGATDGEEAPIKKDDLPPMTVGDVLLARAAHLADRKDFDTEYEYLEALRGPLISPILGFSISGFSYGTLYEEPEAPLATTISVWLSDQALSSVQRLAENLFYNRNSTLRLIGIGAPKLAAEIGDSGIGTIPVDGRAPQSSASVGSGRRLPSSSSSSSSTAAFGGVPLSTLASTATAYRTQSLSTARALALADNPLLSPTEPRTAASMAATDGGCYLQRLLDRVALHMEIPTGDDGTPLFELHDITFESGSGSSSGGGHGGAEPFGHQSGGAMATMRFVPPGYSATTAAAPAGASVPTGARAADGPAARTFGKDVFTLTREDLRSRTALTKVIQQLARSANRGRASRASLPAAAAPAADAATAAAAAAGGAGESVFTAAGRSAETFAATTMLTPRRSELMSVDWTTDPARAYNIVIAPTSDAKVAVDAATVAHNVKVRNDTFAPLLASPAAIAEDVWHGAVRANFSLHSPLIPTLTIPAIGFIANQDASTPAAGKRTMGGLFLPQLALDKETAWYAPAVEGAWVSDLGASLQLGVDLVTGRAKNVGFEVASAEDSDIGRSVAKVATTVVIEGSRIVGEITQGILEGIEVTKVEMGAPMGPRIDLNIPVESPINLGLRDAAIIAGVSVRSGYTSVQDYSVDAAMSALDRFFLSLDSVEPAGTTVASVPAPAAAASAGASVSTMSAPASFTPLSSPNIAAAGFSSSSSSSSSSRLAALTALAARDSTTSAASTGHLTAVDALRTVIPRESRDALDTALAAEGLLAPSAAAAAAAAAGRSVDFAPAPAAAAALEEQRAIARAGVQRVEQEERDRARERFQRAFGTQSANTPASASPASAATMTRSGGSMTAAASSAPVTMTTVSASTAAAGAGTRTLQAAGRTNSPAPSSAHPPAAAEELTISVGDATGFTPMFSLAMPNVSLGRGRNDWPAAAQMYTSSATTDFLKDLLMGEDVSVAVSAGAAIPSLGEVNVENIRIDIPGHDWLGEIIHDFELWIKLRAVNPFTESCALDVVGRALMSEFPIVGGRVENVTFDVYMHDDVGVPFFYGPLTSPLLLSRARLIRSATAPPNNLLAQLGLARDSTWTPVEGAEEVQLELKITNFEVCMRMTAMVLRPTLKIDVNNIRAEAELGGQRIDVRFGVQNILLPMPLSL